MSGPGTRVAVVSCISQSTRDAFLLRPFSGSSQDIHPDKLDVQKQAGGEQQEQFRQSSVTADEVGEKNLAASLQEWRGGERGLGVSSGKGTGQQEDRREVSVLMPPY